MSNVATIQVFGQLGDDAKFTPLQDNATRGRINMRIGSNFWDGRQKKSEVAWYNATIFTGSDRWDKVRGFLGKGAKVLVWGEICPRAGNQGGRDFLDIERAEFQILESKEPAGGAGAAAAPPTDRYVYDPAHPHLLYDKAAQQWVNNPNPGQPYAPPPPPQPSGPPTQAGYGTPAQGYGGPPAGGPPAQGYGGAPPTGGPPAQGYGGAPGYGAPGAAPPGYGSAPPASTPPYGAAPGSTPGGQPPV